MEINSLPDASIFEYLLVFRPHESLQERILHIRKDFHEQFLTDQPLLSTPQIGLVRFEQYEQLQEKWMRRIHLFSMGASPFKVELRDFFQYLRIPSLSILPQKFLYRILSALSEQKHSNS